MNLIYTPLNYGAISCLCSMCKVPTTRDHRDLVQISGKMSHADDLMQHFSNNEQVIRYNFVH